MKLFSHAFFLILTGGLLLPFQVVAVSGGNQSFDVCIDPATDFRLDDADGDLAPSAGDGLTVATNIWPAGSIPTDGVGASPDCSSIAAAPIGTFMAHGTFVVGLPNAKARDLAFVDWHFRINRAGAFDTTGPVKITIAPLGKYPHTITGGRGDFKSLKGQATVLVLDGTNGFQIRVTVSNSRD